MSITRRQILAGSTVALVAAGCTATGTLISPTVLADLQGLVPTVQAIVSAVTQYDPKLLNATEQQTLASLEASATAALTSLNANTPVTSAATNLQTIDSYLNEALSAIGSALPAAAVAFPELAPFVPMFDAAVALIAGVLEPYINSLITSATPAPAAHHALPPSHYTVAQARLILHIR
jgi:hypothetical protein